MAGETSTVKLPKKSSDWFWRLSNGETRSLFNDVERQSKLVNLAVEDPSTKLSECGFVALARPVGDRSKVFAVDAAPTPVPEELVELTPTAPGVELLPLKNSPRLAFPGGIAVLPRRSEHEQGCRPRPQIHADRRARAVPGIEKPELAFMVFER
jgi:hypothetical protein